MAIDSAEKRRCAAGIPFTPFLGLTPDAAAGAAWRQQAGWGYSGIAADGAVPEWADFVPVWLRRRRILTNII